MLLSWKLQYNLILGCSFASSPPQGAETPALVPKLPVRGGDNVLDPWVALREQGCALCSQGCSLPLASGSMLTYKVCVGNSSLQI